MSDIFISYSRRNIEFVRRLWKALDQQSRNVWVDWEDIPPAAEWLPEISAAIESSDTFIFVISPESIRSEVCLRELRHAIDHRKRLLPILHHQPEYQTIPSDLAALNWIFFREEDNFNESLDNLVKAIETDLPFVKEHTRLLMRALEWDRKKQDESLLLRGSDLLNAQLWLGNASLGKEPPTHPLQVEYMQVSQALRERERQQALAMQLAQQAELSMKQEGRMLPRSVLLALESMHRFPSSEGYRALRNGLALLPRPVARIQHRDRVLTVAFSPDGRRVASASRDGMIRLWDVAAQRDVASMSHDAAVNAVSFSPDGERMATASDDKTVCLWETATGRQLALMHHDAPALTVEFSGDGRWLLTSTGRGFGPGSAGPGTAWVWDTISGQAMAQVAHTHLAALSFLTFIADGPWVISASNNGEMLLWEATTGESSGRVRSEDIVTAMACHPTQPLVAATDIEMNLKLWDLADGRRLATIELGLRSSPVVFSPQGRWLSAVTGDGNVRVWETGSAVANLHEVARFPHEKGVTALSFSPDEQLLATVSYWGGTVHLWNLRTGKEIARIAQDNASAVAFSADGRWLVSAGDESAAWVWEVAGGGDALWVLPRVGKAASARFSPDGEFVAMGATTYETATGWITSPADLGGILRVLDVSSGRVIGQVPHKAPVKKVEFGPDGQRLASVSRHQVFLWDSEDWREVSRLEPGSLVNDLAFSPEGARVVTATDDGIARVWDIETGLETARMDHGARVFAVTVSPNSQWVASASEDKTTRIWEVATGREVSRITHPEVPAWRDYFRLCFSPDGRWLASPGAENTAGVWEAATGREVARTVHEDSVIALAFSPDGERVVTSTAKSTGSPSPGEVRVWEAATGRTIGARRLESPAVAVAFSPDGQWVAAGQSDGGILIWEPQTQHSLIRLEHENSVNSVAFSPDGRLLVSASQDETVRVWLWRPQDLVEEACARLVRNLGAEEWNQYLKEEKYRKTCPNLPGEEERSL